MKQEIIEWKKSEWESRPNATTAVEITNDSLGVTIMKIIHSGARIVSVVPTETDGGYSFQQVSAALIIIEK